MPLEELRIVGGGEFLFAARVDFPELDRILWMGLAVSLLSKLGSSRSLDVVSRRATDWTFFATRCRRFPRNRICKIRIALSSLTNSCAVMYGVFTKLATIKLAWFNAKKVSYLYSLLVKNSWSCSSRSTSIWVVCWIYVRNRTLVIANLPIVLSKPKITLFGPQGVPQLFVFLSRDK